MRLQRRLDEVTSLFVKVGLRDAQPIAGQQILERYCDVIAHDRLQREDDNATDDASVEHLHALLELMGLAVTKHAPRAPKPSRAKSAPRAAHASRNARPSREVAR
ncbi:MAG: hypothetical protein ACHREM_01055 [Polyangiales bacterium]